MVVLSALVSTAGLAASKQYLVQHGLRSTAWRAREGSLKLVIAGLLLTPPREPLLTELGGKEARGTARPRRVRQRNERKAGLSPGGGGDSGEPVDHEGRKQRIELEAGGAEGSSTEQQLLPTPQKGSGVKDTTFSVDEMRKLVCDVGALLTDERPEVSAGVLSKGFSFEVYCRPSCCGCC